MIKNGKFFEPPSGDAIDIKQMFQRMVAVGAGRPVDPDGFTPGPWTPELLTEEISRLALPGEEIDLRTVQLWFANNQRGISAKNIRWLARIFGCECPEATAEWQVALTDAQARIAQTRRNQRSAQSEALANRKPEGHGPLPPDTHVARPTSSAGFVSGPVPETQGKTRASLAFLMERSFGETSGFNLAAMVFAGSVALLFLAYVSGVHDVTYSPAEGLTKQVGYVWAPNWTILNLILLPVFILSVSGLVGYWKDVGRKMVLAGRTNAPLIGWHHKVASNGGAFRTIFFFSFGVVFLLQWGGLHVAAIRSGDPGGILIDWVSVAIVRPDLMSEANALVLTMAAFFYTAVSIFVYLTGLLFLYLVAADFSAISKAERAGTNRRLGFQVEAVRQIVAHGIFRSVLSGLLMIICIKVQVSYLQSDAPSIIGWLSGDFLSFLSGAHWSPERLGQSSLTNSSVIALLVTTSFVQISALVMLGILPGQGVPESKPLAHGGQLGPRSDRPTGRVGWKMLASGGLLVASCLAIGFVPGFTALLTIAVLGGVFVALGPGLQAWQEGSERHMQSGADVQGTVVSIKTEVETE